MLLHLFQDLGQDSQVLERGMPSLTPAGKHFYKTLWEFQGQLKSWLNNLLKSMISQSLENLRYAL